MLIEVWRHAGGGPFSVYVPADRERQPSRCRRLADDDWRYLVRFHAAEVPTVECGQTRYMFKSATANAIVAAAEPCLEESDAG